MRRRNISLNGQKLYSKKELIYSVKTRLRNKFETDEATINRLVDFIVQSGWQEEDIVSTLTQADNKSRPPVQAFTFHNEHVIDQLMLTQGTYTHFTDTAQDPNYALRHKGQAELILRRLTPGDLIMLQAAQHMSTSESISAEDVENYWECLWQHVLGLLIPKRHKHHAELSNNPYTAAATAYSFFTRVHRYAGKTGDFEADINLTFMQEFSRFYTGVRARYERIRQGDGYAPSWNFSFVEDSKVENLWMTAVVVTLYAIDEHARHLLSTGYASAGTDGYSKVYKNHIADLLPLYTEEEKHGIQEEESTAAAERSEPDVPSSRLLP